MNSLQDCRPKARIFFTLAELSVESGIPEKDLRALESNCHFALNDPKKEQKLADILGVSVKKLFLTDFNYWWNPYVGTRRRYVIG